MFGEVVTGIVPKAQVTLLDLAYRPGARKVSDRMVEIGADAGDMSMIPNNSMDYVCLHNAFEHFCEDSDTRCVQEIGRILRPGGRAVIIPFMMAPLYTILINPVACFFIHKNNYFERVVQDEFQSHGAQIKFTKGFVSPFARLYNAQQARKRVLAAAKNLDVCLFYISFEDVMSSPGNHDELIFGQQLRYDLFERSPYYFLEFVKRAVTE
jgi:ubiquinone/menaquinone biosynthesis C-methylase UbiE